MERNRLGELFKNKGVKRIFSAGCDCNLFAVCFNNMDD